MKTVVVLLRGVAVVFLALSFMFTSTLARADELDDKKKKLDQQISKSESDLHDYNQQAAKAAATLEASEKQLDEAETALSEAEDAESAAKEKDEKAAKDLKKAQEALDKARAEAKKAKAEVDKWMKTVGRVVIQSQQQRTDLLGVAVLTTDTRMSNLNQRVQWTRSMQESTQAKLDKLTELKMLADSAEELATKAEKALKKKREEAAAAYDDAQAATEASQEARDAHAAAVKANEDAKAVADAQVQAEKDRQKDLKTESDSVQKRINERIARQKAAEEKARQEAAAEARRKAAAAAAEARAQKEAEEAERKAEAARRAAAKASAAQKAAAQKAAKKAEADAAAKRRAAKKSSAAKKAASTKRSTIRKSTSSGLIYPSTAVITSPYGMRFHPVLHYWKLHDGTDFGASCGSPIRAAANGTVEERYYNAGYGNRLIIDHGKYNGRYLTTAYNHATHYIVSPGQYVRQGQVIGYVGSTGYSTGCHLHYMTYVNGEVTNPMQFY